MTNQEFQQTKGWLNWSSQQLQKRNIDPDFEKWLVCCFKYWKKQIVAYKKATRKEGGEALKGRS